MSFFKDELKNVKAFVFDVDGVLSKDFSPLDEKGEPVRTANIKDGFVIRIAGEKGFPVAIITGGIADRVKLRYERLGVKHYYDRARNKMCCLNDFLEKTGLTKEDILYMGDDILDYPVMVEVGVPTCPQDAVPEIKAVSKYISNKPGGEGCVRDVIEQTLRAQNKWFSEELMAKNNFE
ncbi:MAG: 3-deoxy-D-manno-octulosonate 8-phosphate phosphatase [Draconibacterium sp.]